ncbi:flavin reductase family protein [Uliginosibacterium sediminicola]|uniref:Flavin reductase family protein n=1 Tax=Uliginosibacterium sediminicola TaxID=2024550 RepID=A0ABU9YUK1_9RHOO
MQHTLDTQALRRTLGQFATGITVVTTLDAAGQPCGLTVNSFNAVSLEPPLVVWSLSAQASLREAFEHCAFYAVNVLSAEQQDVSQRFASKQADRFAGLEWDAGIGGVPLLRNCCAHFQLRNTQRHEGGDHLMFISAVEAFERFEKAPLIYFSGAYRRLAEV